MKLPYLILLSSLNILIGIDVIIHWNLSITVVSSLLSASLTPIARIMNEEVKLYKVKSKKKK